MYQYNDYELLYLIYEGESEALGILFKKYDGLIKKRLNDYHIKRINYDDYYQECLLALFVAVKKFNPFLNKTFTNFFDLILVRRIRALLNHDHNDFYRQILIDDELEIKDESSDIYQDETLTEIGVDRNKILKEEAIRLDGGKRLFSDWETKVYKLRYIDKYPIQEIAKITGADIRKVYNSLYQIKKKLKAIKVN